MTTAVIVTIIMSLLLEVLIILIKPGSSATR